MEAQTALIEGGYVHLPREAPWLATFLNELLGFPNAKYDDQVDSVWIDNSAYHSGNPNQLTRAWLDGFKL